MHEGSLQDLIDALGRLPGVGPKSAQRLAFHLLQTDAATVENLAKLLLEVKQKVKSCKTCGLKLCPLDPGSTATIPIKIYPSKAVI